MNECLKEIKSIELLPDGEIALYGGTGGDPGLVVIAGTGSICCGRNRQGKHLSAGGWGPIVGDEGGASWIARKALQAVAHAADGRGPKTTLTAVALNYFKVETADDLSTAIYSQTMTNDRLAGFGKDVLRAARTGDDSAVEILREAGQELGVAAIAVIRKLRMEKDDFRWRAWAEFMARVIWCSRHGSCNQEGRETRISGTAAVSTGDRGSAHCVCSPPRDLALAG